MSAGRFVRVAYQASYRGASVHPIRVQPETLEADAGGELNAAPTDPITIPITAKISLNRQESGLRPRYVVLRAPEEDPPEGYAPLGITRIPCLTEEFFDACVANVEVGYLGTTFTVVSTEPERTK